MPSGREFSGEERQTASIGELYEKITVSSKDFEEGERKLEKKIEHPFVRLCRRLHAYSPSFGNGGILTAENKSAMDFLGWKLTAEEYTAAAKIVLVVSLGLAFLAGMVVLFTPLIDVVALLTGGGVTALIFSFMPFLLVASAVIYYFQMYPQIEAKREQTKALTYVPEMMGYMIMSIKLVPNLEKAIEFAAEHGRGKIADDFKNLIWEVQIGVHNSISEGLDALAYRWGKHSEEFKRALMRIRASVIENTEAKRYALLDQTMTEMLESIRSKMEQYARNLSQPSTLLFYIGILLPLLLIIILPVGSSFSGAPLANPLVLFLIYNIIIPLVTIAFAYSLIQNKPPTYEAPVIPDNYPGLPPKWKARIGGTFVDIRFIAAAIAVLGLVSCFVVSTQGIPPKSLYGALGLDEQKYKPLVAPDKSKEQVLVAAGRNPSYFALDETGLRYGQLLGQRLPGAETDEDRQKIIETVKKDVLAEEQIFFSQSRNDVAPYKLVFGLLITFSLVLYVLLFYSSIYKKKAQEDVQEMESEFKDSLYVLASRMGENKPVEVALKHVQEFLPDAKVSKTIFARTLDNINLLGMPLESAVFDKDYGSVSKIPSNIIRGSMKMLIDSVQLGVNVAARTMISLSIQLRNSEKVNETLKILVSDITGTMKTMTIFIAPIVLGITTSLQRIVIVTISSIASQGASSAASSSALAASGSSFSGLSVSGLVSSEAIAGIASPTQFIIIVALYIVELVFILGYFTTKIEEDNDLLVKINIAKFMPIAITIFVLSMLISNLLLATGGTGA